MKRVVMSYAYIATVAGFAAALVRFLGWHWAAWIVVAPVSFFLLAFVAGIISAALESFTGNPRQ